MTKYKDLTGKKFGRLKAVEFDREKTKRKAYWICECECGNIKTVRSDMLQSGNTKSCGCIKKEQDRINLTKHHSHKMTGTRLYKSWQNMKSRCYNPNDKRYERYGGRGIKVYDEWLNSSNSFIEWALSNGYKDTLTIDRIDNDGDYEPSNCRWVDSKSQANNRESNIVVEYNNQEFTITELAELKGLPPALLFGRYERGDRGERLIRKSGEDRDTQKGTKNVNNKISEEQAKLIKEKLSRKEKPLDIAKEMKVSKYIVYDIKRGRTWNWI